MHKEHPTKKKKFWVHDDATKANSCYWMRVWFIFFTPSVLLSRSQWSIINSISFKAADYRLCFCYFHRWLIDFIDQTHFSVIPVSPRFRRDWSWGTLHPPCTPLMSMRNCVFTHTRRLDTFYASMFRPNKHKSTLFYHPSPSNANFPLLRLFVKRILGRLPPDNWILQASPTK